ncbi:hypothetical protein, partial [Klebsiella pneumoniae]
TLWQLSIVMTGNSGTFYARNGVSMKERKLVIEIDDNAIDSVIEKVRLLKDELRSLNLPINISVAVPAALKPEEERNTQDARSVFLSNLDAEITQAWSSLTELLNIRRDATSSD